VLHHFLLRITAMPRTITTNDTEDQLRSAITWVEEHGDEVIVETEGHPRAVIMSFADYDRVRALRDRQRREQALAEVRALRKEVRARNQDLTDEEAWELADRFVHEVVEDMAKEGKLRFERQASE
jgi:PHD/YefM family antitoxin component YafN of YafNO toxin-antitoxin module